jgi:hypothetical protein
MEDKSEIDGKVFGRNWKWAIRSTNQKFARKT